MIYSVLYVLISLVNAKYLVFKIPRTFWIIKKDFTFLKHLILK